LIDRYGLGFRHESCLFRFTVLNFPAKFSWNISGGRAEGEEREPCHTEMPRAPAELYI
jgi:hypothetical protein